MKTGEDKVMPTIRCDACRRPTSRWSALCRECLAELYRIEAIRKQGSAPARDPEPMAS